MINSGTTIKPTKLLSKKPRQVSWEAKDLNISTLLSILTQLCGGIKMKRVTFSIPKELKERLDKMPEINWPEVFKNGIKKRLAELEKFEELKNRGEL